MLTDKKSLLLLVTSKASNTEYDWTLLNAIITVESNYDPYAMRYEKGWTYLESPGKFATQNSISVDTETHLQMFSYGLCQLMGGTARWLGYQGPLVGLLDPETNIDLMIKRLNKIKSMFGYIHEEDVIAAYNAGQAKKNKDGTYANQAYVDKVMKVMLH